MTKPLTLLLFEKILPGSQLLHRLEDLGYRVQVVAEPEQLVELAEAEGPMLVMADLEPRHETICHVIEDLRRSERTCHIPVVAIAGAENEVAQQSARAAGATLVVSDHAILQHLRQFLDQALDV